MKYAGLRIDLNGQFHVRYKEGGTLKEFGPYATAAHALAHHSTSMGVANHKVMSHNGPRGQDARIPVKE